MLATAAHPLATVNALLNATAAILLVAGYWLIRRQQIDAHRRVMLGAFGVSTLFLASYIVYHVRVGHVAFPGQGGVRTLYLAILFSHIVLAVLVPPLAITTIVLGLRDARQRHRRLARWTLPIWLYVSVTGVVIYVMLYHMGT